MIVCYHEENKRNQGKTMIDKLGELDQLYPRMVEWRRHLHAHPELSFREKETADFIAGRLTEWGIDVRRGFAGNAVLGVLEGAAPGPTVALRADIDALPIQDEKTCAYASKVPGVMHACGHDAHTAQLLAVANWFASRRGELKGRLLFLFQHAEEISPGGAIEVLESGVLDGVKAIYGVHLWTPFETGHVYGKEGPAMAAADEFRITVRGRGGHGGLPHESADPIVAAAHLVTALQTVVSRNVSPLRPAVLSVCMIEGGTTFNIIPDSCSMKGTVRTFDAGDRRDMERRIGEMASLTAGAFGMDAELTFIHGFPPLVNHGPEIARFRRIGVQLFGEKRVHDMEPLMAGEDFARYLERMPGAFLIVGAGNREAGIVHPHHHARFDIDERAMPIAAKLLAGMALDALNDG
jgi:amidohydrolase